MLAHGAGAPQTHPWMVRMAGSLASRELEVFTFNFLYSEARRRLPDKNAVLEATWRAALDAVRARGEVARAQGLHRRQVDGGPHCHPGGGRRRTRCRLGGLVLLGYPLHPPGTPDKLRGGAPGAR